ncbi:hypothetical protein CLOACE_12440 [Clostridium acetireducens DSM 10703]|uniref:FG-GAP repeat protein n=1 Tax=Clostridium acetireducens DSM 10703 TaxID=1121290 RepID=A0A1E8EZF7_9CLOT|nr:VCBS repeat-containing protein [Clostridium acetireducens]OFI06101.1 hypothetical protein CLOACE_12440 [Clostridium acetireducens DSM 10703]
MKFKSIFIKKNQIYLIIAFFIVVISFIIFKKFNISTATLNIISDNKIIKTDFTGDGIEDVLYIKTCKNKYHLQVNSKNKSLYIEPNINIGTLGQYCSYWPMKITLLDIDRNTIPEIFIQSSYNNKALQHIFFWNGTKFQELFFSSNNILGFVDSKNNKTPKVISGSINSNYIVFSNYIFNNKFENFYHKHTNSYMGKDSIFSLIKYIESLQNNKNNIPSNIFYPGLTIKNFYALEKLIEEENVYNFQDALFRDTKWNKDGSPIEIKWILNFKVTPKKIESNNKIKNMYLNVLLKPHKDSYNNTYFKITSINYKLNLE